MRVFLPKGHTIEQPNGAKIVYRVGATANLSDEMADELLKSEVAWKVDANDKPIEPPKQPTQVPKTSSKPIASSPEPKKSIIGRSIDKTAGDAEVKEK